MQDSMDLSGTAPDDLTPAKRKRSLSTSSTGGHPAPPPKTVKTAQLSINYLARQSPEDLPLIHKEDALPNLLHLLSAYSNILDRHESLASNLGARPLGPILIKRFERCFDAPPKIVASHQRSSSITAPTDDSSHQITWLEVIEFARSHPGQFTLSTFSEGKRVCQFYYPQKQLRVQISEEDFLFINSGRCQELIPPLPIWEDEEKEMGTCDVLEARLKELTNAADMVAARTRQLGHRLKGRRAAILERRAEGGSGTPAKASTVHPTTAPPASSTGSGFVAVNAAAGRTTDSAEPSLGSSASVRHELLRHFESLPHNQGQDRSHARQQSVTGLGDGFKPSFRPIESVSAPGEPATSAASSLSPGPPSAFANDVLPYTSVDGTAVPLGFPNQNASYGHRPSSSTSANLQGSASGPLKHNFSRPLPPGLESSQPFRPLCQAHMDGLPRGHRVLPPCDRCRRLRMDCVKNLTSCAGCTRKHARCHWRDVSRDELGALDHLMDSTYSGFAASAYSPANYGLVNGFANGGSEHAQSEDDGHQDESEDDDSNPLEDLEALGEKEEQEREDEEGLRNAKDLARQGWEESVRSNHQTDLNGPDQASAGRNDTKHATPRPAAGDRTREEETSIGDASAPLTKAAPDQVEDLPVGPEPLAVAQSEASRGFRAVNSQFDKVDHRIVSSTGWPAA